MEEACSGQQIRLTVAGIRIDFSFPVRKFVKISCAFLRTVFAKFSSSLSRTIRYVPGKNFNEASLENVHEAGKCMTVPMVVLCCLMVLSGLFSGPLVSFFTQVGSGLI